ncbi:YbaB/EbfC family nucleoid-associated protein [Candidatus Fermentibacteria bacterium]|nr:YbaB/EbfC family nucleoid-associated protein [Candidatus Fermentibacteria bacterium]
MKNMGSFMKQAQRMKDEFQRLQERLAHTRVEGTAGGGMVTAVADGNQNLVEIRIQPEVVNPEDVEMLQDLIVAAVNEARSRSQALMNDEMSKLTGGLQLNLPGLI